MKHTTALLAALLMCGQAAAQEIVSVTTPLNLDQCRHKARAEEEDYGEWQCRGYRGIPVFVSAGDQRTFISYGRAAANEPASRQRWPRSTVKVTSSNGAPSVEKTASSSRLPPSSASRWSRKH